MTAAAYVIPHAAPVHLTEWRRQNYPDNRYMVKRTVFTVRHAAEKAAACRDLLAGMDARGAGVDEMRAAVAKIVEGAGLEMPKAKRRLGFMPVRLRVESDTWWNRQLQRRNVRVTEHGRIEAGRVSAYCSAELLERFRESRRKLREWIERASLEEVDGTDRVNMQTVVEASTSNNVNRRHELMTRVHGMEDYATARRHYGLFITVTAGSGWHRKAGKRWNGASPRDTQRELFCARWALLRAWFNDNGLRPYGLRVAEPHRDATPHWHLLLWFRNREEGRRAVAAFREYFLLFEGPPEKGARFARVKAEWMKPKGKNGKGGAAAYLAKYVAKNVDGQCIEDHTDEEGEAVVAANEGAQRVRAWSSAWGIRQFQFIGGPRVGLWRELRRVRDAGKVPPSLVMLWACADAGDWFGFMVALEVMPTPTLAKRGFGDDLRELAERYRQEGETLAEALDRVPDAEVLALDSMGAYWEPKADRVIGIDCGGEFMPTRDGKRWRIVVSPPEAEGGPQGLPPWTRGNNCRKVVMKGVASE